MMSANSHDDGPGLAALLRKTLSTGMGALHNRSELMMVELQEEKIRLVNLILRGVAGLFLAMMTILLITGTVIFIVPEDYRLIAVGAFAAIYLTATIWLILSMKSMLNRTAFSDSLAQFKKDSELLEVFE